MNIIKELNMTKETFIRKFLAILIGDFFCAMALVTFLRPNEMISGGVTGVAVLIEPFIPLSIGLVLFLLNLPLLILGLIFLDKKFMLFTSMSIFIISFYVGLIDSVLPTGFAATHEVILGCVFGGALNGIGMGITFREGCSTGGFDIIAAIIKQKYNISVGNVLMGINFFIIMASSFVYSFDKALFTLIALFIAYQVMDIIHLGVGKQKQVFIISAKEKEIVETIYSSMRRGITYINGEGAYEHKNFKIIYMICSSAELVKVKSIVKKIDSNAFMAVSDTSEIMGQGFKGIEI